MNKIIVGRQKTIWDPNSEFQKRLEVYKLKSEIKPRKVNMMQSQDLPVDAIDEYQARKLYVPNKGGFVK